MPEIKNTFLGGKMNKDLDERLLPKGQYRDANNIEVATAEDSSVGTVRNILGNKRLESIIPSDFKCVGAIADEKNNKLYWFVSTYLKDAIMEYDVVNDVVLPVVVDLNASNSKAVLKFGTTPTITGVNIIDNLLLWTDNISDPKKINIDQCKEGTPDFNTHTKLKFEEGSFHAITLQNISNTAAGNNFLVATPKRGAYFWYNVKQAIKMLGITEFTSNQEDHVVRQYRNGKFIQERLARFSNGANGTSCSYASGSANDDFHVGDIIYGNDVQVDIEERHVTVVKPKPLIAMSVKVNYNHTLDAPGSAPNIFETKLPRFSYRYKFRDGEFSTFAPFTGVVFNPRYPKDLNSSVDSNIFYSRDNVYNEKEPSNKAMVNSIQSIELSNFITSNTPEDVVEIDILYKQESSSTIYSVKSIKRTDKQWHSNGSSEGHNLGYNKDQNSSNYSAQGGNTKGKYVVTTENIYAALPANQLLRPWDNVPRRALAQEVTGNRVVYGNYLQNYNLGTYTPDIKVSYSDRSSQIGSFETQGLPSLKSQRNYQLGVVYCDEHGRETPVLSSESGALNIPWSSSNGLKNASRSLQLNTSVSADLPEWVDSMKFFVKETSNEYYNLVMSRAWVTEKTYELDNSEGHIWISFPSSDRNKVAEGEYIILKKKIGVGESQVEQENKFKIIDISNEAPDAIKYELINQGIFDNTGDRLSNDIFDSLDFRPDLVGNRNIYFDKQQWIANGIVKGIPYNDGDDENNSRLRIEDLYMSWRRLDGEGKGLSSMKYKVEGGRDNGNGYMFKLKDKISQVDADVAHVNGLAEVANTEALLHPDLHFQIQRKVKKSGEDFSGSFFVKISKNQITDLIDSGNPVNTLDNYQVSSKAPTYFFRDDIAYNVKIDNASYGLTNYNGFSKSTLSLANNIQDAANNSVGQSQTNIYPSTFMRLTDHAAAWDGILSVHGRTFFIDAMHMASGQSEASDYAKYNCVTWSGAGDGTAVGVDSAWSYPPLKTWLTDFEKSTELLEIVEANAIGYDNVATDLYYDNDILSTSPIVAADADWSGEKVDGWVGPVQAVDRQTFVGSVTVNHVNGLEGLVTTVDDHAAGPRRWFSGITGNPTEYGAGVDTKTYSDGGELGRHFIHVSFLAPGEDLHDGTDPTEDYELFGDNAVGNTLQGIWGGGHFTGPTLINKYGSGAEKHFHICLEGNNDSNNNYLPKTPGPGVGFGYDLNYKEKHYRQWDPTFPSDPGNKIRDFLRKLHPGSQFKFLNPTKDENDTVYTIKSVSRKKIYNHTNWRSAYNRYKDDTETFFFNQNQAYKSVEETALAWLNQVDDDGETGTGGFASGSVQKNLLNKIKDFGKASNRRVCYIIELDKNPADADNYNPLAAADDCTADKVNENFCNIEFLDKVKSVFLSDLSKFPAIWETDPVKQEVDLDIYFEASGNVPVRLNNKTNEIIAPLGCRVEILNSPVGAVSHLIEWNDKQATLEPGFALWDGANEIDYSGVSFKFTRQDGSFIIIKADNNTLVGATSSSGNKTLFRFENKIGENIRIGLAWNNCFSFGNGLESNRIKDDFNQPFLANGVKASTTTQRTYEEERRSTGLIYSGLYNSNSGVNDLNQFIMAEKITKDLNPTYGSIQKLFSRNSDLVTFCEDKVVKVLANKDAVFNADGNPQLTANESVLGQTIPFIGEFGISKNPESFASESYRAYFTDKNRGAVIRLSKDGLTPISSSGMSDWFRDNLRGYSSLIGTYDVYKQDYNLTLSHGFGENIIFNSFLESGGVVAADEAGNIANIIQNSAIYLGTNLQYPYEADNIINNVNYTWGSGNENLLSTVKVTNHAEIPQGSLQSYVAPVLPQAEIQEVITTTQGALISAGANVILPGDEAYSETTPIVVTQAAIDYAAPQFGSSGQLQDNGNIYYPGDFAVPTSTDAFHFNGNNLFGSSAVTNSDSNISSVLRRKFPVSGTNAFIDEANEPTNGSNSYPTATGPKEFFQNLTTKTGAQDPYANNRILQNHATGGILFNRVQQGNTYNRYVEFGQLGAINGLGNATYDALNTTTPGGHAAMYAGDEIEIKVEIIVQSTPSSTPYQPGSNWEAKKSYNIIQPFIQILDGTSYIQGSDLLSYQSSSIQPAGQAINETLYWQNSFNANLYINEGWNDSGSVSGISYSTDKAMIMGGNTATSRVLFLTTTTTSDTANQGNQSFETYTLMVRYKFKSSTQSYSAGSQFYDEKIISNLAIRIGNYKGNSTNNGTNAYSGNLANQKWEISSVKVRKLLGIVAPDVEEQAEQSTGGVTTNYPASYTWVPAVYAPDIDTVTTPYSAEVLGVAEVTAVPPTTIPAWTEIRHSGLNVWQKEGTGAGDSWSQARSASGFGNNYYAVAATGYAQNFSDPTGDSGAGSVINYVTPDPNPSDFNSPFDAANPYPSALANGDGTANSGLLISNYQNTYQRIKTNSVEQVSFYYNINGDPWVDGKWYLVDIEYDANAYPNAGDGTTDNGYIIVDGVADLSGVIGDDIDSDSFGKFAGSASKKGVRLMPTTRTEYGNPDGSGDNKSVLRGIFQFSANSWRSEFNFSHRKNTFRIRCWDFVNHMHIEKIISRKLQEVTSTGDADNWYHTSSTQTHSLSPKTVYWSSDGPNNTANTLCFEDIEVTQAGSSKHWSQDFASGNGPVRTDQGWKFTFTITKNPRTSTFEGELELFINSELDIANDPQSITPMSQGIYLTGIIAEGAYEINFNFEDADSGWTVAEPGGANNTTISPNSGITTSAMDNRISFLTTVGVKTVCGIKDLVLADKSLVLLGGTVESWSWQGFDDSANSYITWEDTVQQATAIQENRILFANCPIVDTNSTLDQIIQISASQYIETPVNRYEHYIVSVDHGVTTGELEMYYFNKEGFGFRVTDLDASNQGTVSTNVVIGNEEWSNINPVDSTYAPEMKETFVIKPRTNSVDVNGWIDNITMTRNYATEVTQNTDPSGLHYVLNESEAGEPVAQANAVTVSFSEKVKGWTSFKDFVPENGVGVSSKYFTFKKGGLYEHYVPMSYDTVEEYWVMSNPDLAENYNRFYGITTYKSSLKAILNEEPSAVKTFDTINYEGSQAFVKLPTSVEYNTIDQLFNKSSRNLLITQNNAQAWTNSADTKGWECVDVKTDLEAGSIKEFINKEGKWFGYIKGSSLSANLDTTRFSVQGLGKASTVTPTAITAI